MYDDSLRDFRMLHHDGFVTGVHLIDMHVNVQTTF